MEWIVLAPAIGLGALLVLLGSTLAFDVVHVSLHRMAASPVAWIRSIGALHETHHRFLDRELVVHAELEQANLRRHVIPEFLTQASFSAVLLLVLPPAIVIPAFAVQVLVFLYILRSRGRDVNHRGVEALRAHRPHFFCLPEYHAWHHAHPEAHFSSWIKLLDVLLATGSSLEGRRLVLTGVDEPFGRALRDALVEAGVEPAECFGGAPPASLAERLRDVDVLVLAHAPVSEAEPWIEDFCRATSGRKLPPEVWGVDGGAAGLGVARRRFSDPRVVYRHLAVAAGSPPERAARRALDAVLRGLHRVSA